jgi:hypothetical protein
MPDKISKHCTVGQLRHEALYRGLDIGTVPLPKNILLQILGDGSASAVASARKKRADTVTILSEDNKTAPRKRNTQTNEKEPESHPTANPNSSKNAKRTNTQSVAAASRNQCDKSTTSNEKQKNGEKVNGKGKKTNGKKASRKRGSKSQKKETNSSNPTANGKSSKNARKATTQLTAEPARKRQKTDANATKPKKQNDKSPKKDPIVKVKKQNPSSSIKGTTTAITTATTTVTIRNTNLNNCTSNHPRIHENLTLDELRDEARARRLYMKRIPKSKPDLLRHLIDGSIHVAQSEEYKQYLALLDRVKAESAMVPSQPHSNVDEKKSSIKPEHQQNKLEKDREAQDNTIRENEISSQQVLHSHMFFQVHPHALAFTSQLKHLGQPRVTACNICSHSKNAYYTCEKCDWDVCYDCFEYENMTDEQRQANDGEQCGMKKSGSYESNRQGQKISFISVKKEDKVLSDNTSLFL